MYSFMSFLFYNKWFRLTYIFLWFNIAANAQTDTVKKLKVVKIVDKSNTTTKSITPVQQLQSKDFKRYTANTVADAIRNFAGVNIKDYGGIGGLKTVSVRSLGANHTGVFYDGVQLNDAQNGQVDLGKLSLNNVQQVQLYNAQPDEINLPARTFASASIILIKPVVPLLTAEKPYQVKVDLKTGSSGLLEHNVQWKQRVNEQWSYLLNTLYNVADGKYKYKIDGDGSESLYTRKNSDIRSFQTDGTLFYAKDSSQFNLRLNYFTSERGLPGAVIYYNDKSSQRLWNKDFFIQSKYSKKYNNSFKLLLNGKFSNAYIRYLDPDYLNQVGELDQRYNQQEFYQSTAISYQPIKNFNVAYAADIALNNLKTNLYQYAYPVRYTLLQNVAANYNLNKINIQANVLHTYIHEYVKIGIASPNRSVFSPTILFKTNPFQALDLNFRAYYKDVYRLPTFNDLYYTRLGNTSLKPERATQYNCGITFNKTLANALNYISLTADAYYNLVKDKIVAVPNKDIFSWTMLNVGKVDIRGLDAGFKTNYQINKTLIAVLSANYTFQQALDVTSEQSATYLNQIPYTPEHNLALNIGLSERRWGVYYNYVYSSGRYYIGENLPEYLVPGFSVSDISAQYAFKLYKLPVSSSVEINNLFNTNYAFIRSFPMPRRSFRLSMQITI
jgi:vitamin B12 transporter